LEKAKGGLTWEYFTAGGRERQGKNMLSLRDRRLELGVVGKRGL
jgi:hypothetical protein